MTNGTTDNGDRQSDVDEPALLRTRKAPVRFDDGRPGKTEGPTKSGML